MKKLYQVLVQNADEGHWDVMFDGTEKECQNFVTDFIKDEENDGTWITVKVEEVKSNESFTMTELHIMYMALSNYYNELIDQSYGESDLIQRYMDEKKAVILKLERMVK